MEANIPRRFQGKTLDDYVPRSDHEHEVKRIVAGYLENLDTMLGQGRGLMFSGPPGIGKTLLSCIVANAAIDRGVPSYFTTFETYLRRSKRMFDLASIARVDESAVEEWRQHDSIQLRIRNTVKLLVLDDVGKEHAAPGSDYARDEFDFLLRHRFDRGLTTVISTNTSGESKAWSTKYSPAMQSFIYESCVVVPFDEGEKDRRRSRNRR